MLGNLDAETLWFSEIPPARWIPVSTTIAVLLAYMGLELGFAVNVTGISHGSYMHWKF